MPRLQFYLTDITYKPHDNQSVVHLFGRTPDGKQVCVLDGSFEPYLWVLPKQGQTDAVIESLRSLAVQDGKLTHRIVRVDKETRNVRETPTPLLRVTVSTPKAVPALRDLIKETAGVKDFFEHDILFVRRYLIDRGFLPLTLLEADAEPVESRVRVPAYRASRISAASEQGSPEMKMLSLDIETYVQEGKGILPEENPILMIALYGAGFRKLVTWREFATEDPSIEFVKDEGEMLARIRDHINIFGPDALVTYNGDGFDLPYILTRARKCGVRFDINGDYTEPARVGRVHPEVEMTGVVHIDLLRFVRVVVGRSLETDSYSLNAVAEELIGETKHDVDVLGISDAWDNHPARLEEYCQYNIHDAKIAYELCRKLLPNMTELVRIIGLPLHDCIRMTFSQLVEWYCIRAAAAANEIVPNKPEGRERQRRSVEHIQGAFVFEPTPGLYSSIAVFDYRSLYPSIIASHNISIGTLNCSCCEGGRLKVPLEGRRMWFCTRRRGFLSRIIEDLISRRARIKSMLKENKGDPLLAARSEALKLLANSFYGYLGFAAARWYCLECAESTTAWGRHYIKKVIAEAEKSGFKVLYSDTDSVFLLLEDKGKGDALRFAEQVNTSLPGVMELDFENYYTRGIFVQTRAGEGGAKKRYALADEKGNMKIKGFETVRRNTSVIAKEVQRAVLEMVLRDNEPEKALAYVTHIITDLREHAIPVEKVVIVTQLQKDIADYESAGPHVAAAQRIAARGKAIGPGAIVKFVIAKGSGKIRDKVRLPDEEGAKEYDAEYYINNQVVPVVERIFAVLGMPLDALVNAPDKKQKTLGQWG